MATLSPPTYTANDQKMQGRPGLTQPPWQRTPRTLGGKASGPVRLGTRPMPNLLDDGRDRNWLMQQTPSGYPVWAESLRGFRDRVGGVFSDPLPVTLGMEEPGEPPVWDEEGNMRAPDAMWALPGQGLPGMVSVPGPVGGAGAVARAGKTAQAGRAVRPMPRAIPGKVPAARPAVPRGARLPAPSVAQQPLAHPRHVKESLGEFQGVTGGPDADDLAWLQKFYSDPTGGTGRGTFSYRPGGYAAQQGVPGSVPPQVRPAAPSVMAKSASVSTPGPVPTGPRAMPPPTTPAPATPPPQPIRGAIDPREAAVRPLLPSTHPGAREEAIARGLAGGGPGISPAAQQAGQSRLGGINQVPRPHNYPPPQPPPGTDFYVPPGGAARATLQPPGTSLVPYQPPGPPAVRGVPSAGQRALPPPGPRPTGTDWYASQGGVPARAPQVPATVPPLRTGSAPPVGAASAGQAPPLQLPAPGATGAATEAARAYASRPGGAYVGNEFGGIYGWPGAGVTSPGMGAAMAGDLGRLGSAAGRAMGAHPWITAGVALGAGAFGLGLANREAEPVPAGMAGEAAMPTAEEEQQLPPPVAPELPAMPQPPSIPQPMQPPAIQPPPQFAAPQPPQVRPMVQPAAQPQQGAQGVAVDPADPFAGGAGQVGQLPPPDRLRPVPPPGVRDPERWMAAMERRDREMSTRQRMVQNRAEQRAAARRQRMGMPQAAPPTLTRPLAEAMEAAQRGDAQPYQLEMLERAAQGPIMDPEVEVARINAELGRRGQDINLDLGQGRLEVDREGLGVQRDLGLGDQGVRREIAQGQQALGWGNINQAANQMGLDAWVGQQQLAQQQFASQLANQTQLSQVGADLFGHQMAGRGQDFGFMGAQMQDATERERIRQSQPGYAETLTGMADAGIPMGAADEIARGIGPQPLFAGASVQVNPMQRNQLQQAAMDRDAETIGRLLRGWGASEEEIERYLNQEVPKRLFTGR